MLSQKIYNSSNLILYRALIESELKLPFVSEGIMAGFPSPAMDLVDLKIDLNQYLIKHPSSTFYGIVKGHSMMNVGIDDGNLLVIDKNLECLNNKIAVCYLDGAFTLKRMRIEKNQCWLIPENENFQPIKVTEENDFLVWGVLLHVIKSF